MAILDLSDQPEDPIQAIVWLDGVLAAAKTELNAAVQKAYYDARIKGMFHEALGLGLHSRKRALAFTRHENESRGRTIRQWRDGH